MAPKGSDATLEGVGGDSSAVCLSTIVAGKRASATKANPYRVGTDRWHLWKVGHDNPTQFATILLVRMKELGYCREAG